MIEKAYKANRYKLHNGNIPNANKRHRGNPLDVISLLEDGRFFNDLSDEERTSLDKTGEDDFTNFIIDKLL